MQFGYVPKLQKGEFKKERMLQKSKFHKNNQFFQIFTPFECSHLHFFQMFIYILPKEKHNNKYYLKNDILNDF